MKCTKSFATCVIGVFAGALGLTLPGCSGQSSEGAPASNGGTLSVGGASQQAGSPEAGGSVGTGGQSNGSGGKSGGTGGSAIPVGTGASGGSGGTSSTTGVATGGAPATGGTPATGGSVGNAGGAATGGSPASGGALTAGSTGKGGAGTGGAGTGGANTGGAGGSAKGGATGTGGTSLGNTGGSAKGGAAGTGGTNSGGSSGGTTKITVWLAGDSTMATGSDTSCPSGWGGKFQGYFSSNAKVTNSAVGGTTVRSWLYDVSSTLGSDGECTLTSTAALARWTNMLSGMKAGDYLFVQFGINDTTSATCPKHVSLSLFKELFGMMAQSAKDRGAYPIFLTAVSSIACTGSAARGTRGTFATATKEAATQYNVPVIDLEQLSVALYTASGFCPSTDTAATYTANTPIGNFFCNDHTHFEAAGATQIAGLVAKAIKDQGIALASYLLP